MLPKQPPDAVHQAASMEDFADSAPLLIERLTSMLQQGVAVFFVKESLLIDRSGMSTVRFAKALLALDRARKKKVGRHQALTPDHLVDITKRLAAGEKKAHIAMEYGVSRQTLYISLERLAGNKK